MVDQPITDPTSGSSFDFDFNPDPDPELDNLDRMFLEDLMLII